MAAENEADRPESVDVAQAVAMMQDAEDNEAPVEEAAPEAEDEVAEPDSDETEEQEATADDALEVPDDAPDFWSAEDKALWQDVPEPLRPVIAKYEQQRTAWAEKKEQETAQAREEAARVARAATGLVEQAAAWWKQNGPAFEEAFVKKWADVDWKALAEKDPAEVARLLQQRQEEGALLAEARRRGEADMAAANERAERELVATKRAEHAKLAAKLPEFFGPDRAQQTYDELSRFLFAKGIPADRIAAIHEAPIIELALAAMRFDRAQLALRSRQAGGGGVSAKTTPLRIAPGPASRPGDRKGEAARQVGERFRRSGGASIADAAELIRLNDL